MLEALARLAFSLLLPSSLLLATFLVTLWFALRRRWIPLRCSLLLLTALLAVTMTPVIPDALATSLERTYPPLDPATLPHGAAPPRILVLAAGHVADTTLPPLTRLGPTTLARLVEGIRLHRLLPGSALVVSGASRDDPQPQAVTTAAAAVSLGVAQSAIARLDDPTTTCGEARAYVRTFGTHAPVILVTSALHLPRALQLFRQLGVTAIPAPADVQVKRSPYAPRQFPRLSVDRLALLDAVVHEYVGMQWGRLSCRDSRLRS